MHFICSERKPLLTFSLLSVFFYYVQKNFVPYLRWEFLKENKKVRKQANKNSTKKVVKKIRKFSFFLGRFLGRVLVFLISYFLVFFYKFPPQFRILSDIPSLNVPWSVPG